MRSGDPILCFGNQCSTTFGGSVGKLMATRQSTTGVGSPQSSTQRPSEQRTTERRPRRNKTPAPALPNQRERTAGALRTCQSRSGAGLADACRPWQFIDGVRSWRKPRQPSCSTRDRTWRLMPSEVTVNT